MLGQPCVTVRCTCQQWGVRVCGRRQSGVHHHVGLSVLEDKSL